MAIRLASLLCLMLLCSASVSGANWYVRAGASGDGTSWTSAFGTLTSAESAAARGDTIYVADGTYAGATLNTVTSGSTLITVRKATASEHGTATGWDDTYGDGQAEFTSTLSVTSDYWVFDGVYRTTSRSGYGFAFHAAAPDKGFDLDGDYITIRYWEIEGAGAGTSGGDDGIYATASNIGLLIQHCWLHDFGRCPILGRGWDDCTVEYCLLERNESVAEEHAEGVSLYGGDGVNGCIFRYNEWVDVEGTGIIVVGDAADCEFYGNLIYWTSSYPNTGQGGGYCSNGSITSWTTETHSSCVYYNNTVIIPSSGGLGFAASNMGGGTGNVSRNNLYVSSGTIGTRINHDDGTDHDYNAYSGGNSEGEAHQQTDASISSFTDAGLYDFSLTSNTTAGTDLGSPYDVDITGATRTTWTRGAYEYDGTPDTTAPTISSVSASPSSTSVTVTWTTDEGATSGLEWGLTTSYTGSTTNSSYVTSHSLNATSLSASTTYHYRVVSSDSAGNRTIGSDGTFTTTAEAAPDSTVNSTTANVGTINKVQ